MGSDDQNRHSDPYQVGELEVAGGQTLHWEQQGRNDGLPLLLLHGGPGSGCSKALSRPFDPNVYRIVTYDQRGCGRSRPLGSIDENNLERLVADIEVLRRHLGIDQWVVSGGSWGSTLALAYGTHYPGSCLGFLLRSIFLCSKREIDWWLYGIRSVFPEHWERFTELVPLPERDDLLAAYGRLLNDPATALEAAVAWRSYERSCGSLLPLPWTEHTDVEITIAAARIHSHYFANDFFIDDTKLLQGVDRIRHLPAIIVHGRYDMVCPVANAFDLARKWGSENAELVIVTEAGHTLRDPKLFDAMCASAERLLNHINS